MLEQLWTRVLELTAEFVTPDWGVVIGLIPVLMAIVAVIVLLGLFRRLMKAPPARRGYQRVEPRTPAGIHMPGPSFAPVFAAIGVGLLMLGLVFGGLILVLGVIALVLTLLYWLAEGLRVYDHDIGPTTETLPAVISAGPPPGVHMPGPSWRPFLGAFGVFALLLGLVFGGWVLTAGVICLVATLIGWLGDAVKEYRKTVDADTTGHLENIPPPRPPSRLFGTLVALIVAAGVLQVTNFAIGEASGGAPAESGAASPPASGEPSGGPPPPSGPAADVQVQAKAVQYVEKIWTGPADKPFTIGFDNEDAGIPHNIELEDASGAIVFKGEIFAGVDSRTYDVLPLPAGTYTFLCAVHPTTMTGTATLQ